MIARAVEVWADSCHRWRIAAPVLLLGLASLAALMLGFWLR